MHSKTPAEAGVSLPILVWNVGPLAIWTAGA